ncbi:hypothetical protein [Tichowtungia aerotolerans]|uniref:Beta-galactosidase trimerisation domain-containing protein n=1 Tax=Tichowtungia aerotolerans TaxID=2697043 RepID=A0A6P1M997_9BACT|nr:hypothetical protein [Tichowtungia aerotolerans]QHI69124.1 hypothetical protein GT409_06570 [Tichowtungia aerotolerans]
MNKTTPFKIILRYGLDPYNGLEENLKQLETFIQESTINEVMFLLMPEERSSGHPTEELSKPWIDAIRQAQVMFARYGVETSINPWTTTYHCSRGRHLHDGQNFRLMVGETGADNGMTACPLCENWQQYLCDYFTYLAREIDPVALWVEDDWRLHNHGGEMGYGGCFCDHCLDRFAKMVGEESVTREQVVAAVTAPGEPHPWREKWLELAWAALSEPAQKLTDALKAARPDMRIGLMSSIPDVQSIEKRDWNGLMDIFTEDDENVLIRPHMPPYTEEPPITTVPSYSRQTIAELDRDADIYPELENSPRCGPYSGSHNYSIWEMTNAILYGSRGITINHFDNMGMNTYYDRGFGKALGEQRNMFDALLGLKLDDRKARGVKVLFSPDIAEHKWTGAGASGGGAKMYTGEDLSKFQTGGGSLNDLQANSTEWSKVFYILGISHSFTRDIKGKDGDIFAVSDQTLRSYSDEEIKTLLSQNIILDLPSVEVLVQRGFGDLIGVTNVSRIKLDDSAYSLEEVEESFFGKLAGGVAPRMCAQRCADPIGVFEPAGNAEVLSTIKGAEFEIKFPGAQLFTNELGGTVFSTCYPLGTAQFYMAYFNRVRQEFWTQLLFKMSGQGQTIACGHPFHVHAHDIKDGISVACTNVIYDTSKNVVIKLPAAEIDGKSFQTLEKATWVDVQPQVEIEDDIATLTFDIQVPTLKSAFIVIR